VTTVLGQDEPNGAFIGKYQMIAGLGHGGMADVFLAVVRGPVGFTKLQVIKRLRPNLAEENDFLSMFLDEARLAARLNHPNVVQTNEVGEASGQYFIAMEYLDGQPLNRILLRASKPEGLPLAIGLHILSDALAGLQHAHQLSDYDGTPLSVVHRDASPHNIFVTYDGGTKVVDFGIAKAASRSSETRDGVMKGKIAYMSPEQARCASVDCRADVFSVGIILWELVTGQRMWMGRSDMEILERLLAGTIPRARDVNPDVPAELDAICARALAVSRDDRYPTAAAFRDALRSYADDASLRVTAEDVGCYVADLFEHQRAELKTIIDRQLKNVTNAATGAEAINIVDLQHQTSTFTPSASGTHAVPTVRTGVTGTAEQERRRRLTPLLVGAAALVVGGVVLALRLAPDTGTTSALSAPTALATTASAAGAHARDDHVISLHVGAAPADARIFLDDAPLPSNPYAAKFPSDGAAHRVRVEAEGFQTKTTLAVFDADVSLDITLDPVPKPEVPDAATAAPAKPPTYAPRRPAATKPGRPQLDKNDPWAN
jgi:serine/threonine-protein kinase